MHLTYVIEQESDFQYGWTAGHAFGHVRIAQRITAHENKKRKISVKLVDSGWVCAQWIRISPHQNDVLSVMHHFIVIGARQSRFILVVRVDHRMVVAETGEQSIFVL